MDLKLQQAGVIQVQEASEEALKQGRSIMLFTVITIIFVGHNFAWFVEAEKKRHADHLHAQ